MLKTKLALKKLNKKDQAHLSLMDIHSLDAFKRNLRIQIHDQKAAEAKNPDVPAFLFQCRECATIAAKLNINIDEL